MCSRQGIECCHTSTCKRLCAPADEWADQDYARLLEQPLSMEMIEKMATKQIAHRVDGFWPARIGHIKIAMDCLPVVDRTAIEAVFYDPSGERQSFSEAVKKLGWTRSTLHRRVANALKLLAEHLVGRLAGK